MNRTVQLTSPPLDNFRGLYVSMLVKLSPGERTGSGSSPGPFQVNIGSPVMLPYARA